MKNHTLHIDSADQISDVVKRLRDYEQELHGRAVRLKKIEQQLQMKEHQLKLYRKQILIAIKEQLLQTNNYDEQAKILDKFRDILEFVVQDIKEDIDDIMA